MTRIRSGKVRTNVPIPPAPYLDCRVRDVPQLAEIWSYINPFMLYGRRLGSKGNFEKDLPAHDEKALAIETAEGCAEWLHRRIREDWGFADPSTIPCRSASPHAIAASATPGQGGSLRHVERSASPHAISAS